MLKARVITMAALNTLGKLRHRVTLLRETKTPDGSGGYTSTWQSIGELWAQMLVPKFSQQVIQGGVQSVEQVQARFRKHHGAVVADRIEWDNGRTYEVVAIDDSQLDYDIFGLKLLRKRGA